MILFIFRIILLNPLVFEPDIWDLDGEFRRQCNLYQYQPHSEWLRNAKSGPERWPRAYTLPVGGPDSIPSTSGSPERHAGSSLAPSCLTQNPKQRNKKLYRDPESQALI